MRRIDTLPSPCLDVRDLRLLIALTRTGTTKAAGELLHLAQPSVSRALLALEDRVGHSLFYRGPKGLQPTPVCEQLTERGGQLLTELCDLERTLRKPSAPVSRIRVVSECHTAYHWLPTALLSLGHSMPGVELSLRLECTRDPIAALAADHVDAALLSTPIKASDTLEVRPLFADELVFVVAASHALARRKTITIRDLRAHTLFSGRASAGEQRWFTTSIFGRAQPGLTVSWVPLTEAIVDLARAGLGIGVLTEWVVGPYLERGDVVAKRLARKVLRRPWHLAWQRRLGEAGPHLLRALKACEMPR